ncbi:MAG: excinuclease ABC subunit UvrC [Patescibacteria group bacterium]
MSLVLLIRSKHIPHSPGCYLMIDAGGHIIYVGKAKDLRKRVASYMHARDEKTTSLVAAISDIDFIATDTETESFLLEAQLIQKYHPRYNIDLQSGGTRYAYIKETHESYPRFVIARKVTRDGNFFGPYVSASARNEALRLIYSLFLLCKKPNTGKPCFRYHLGICSGACIRAIQPEEYRQSIESARTFLRGDFKQLVAQLQRRMEDAADKQLFEKAKIYRDQIAALRSIEQQKVARPSQLNQDVCNYIVSGDVLLIQVFHFQKGVISGKKEFRFSLGEYPLSEREIFQSFLEQYYIGSSIPHEIVIPGEPVNRKELEKYLSVRTGHGVKCIVPQRGIKKKLLDMVKKNLTLKLTEHGDQLVELQRLLRLERLPMTIDCVDISTLSGVQSVGSLVQFVNGNSVKSGYRKFIIKNVEGMNDFAMIHEVISRFAKRIKEGKEQQPDLLVIDGGRGQLNSAKKALREAELELPTIGLAKKLEEVYVAWAPKPLRISNRSAALQLLMRLRDEAHRFAITFQRKRRSIKKRPMYRS